jgi:diadenosine tetraphosphate (Ap4A) HIT family hydrolase
MPESPEEFYARVATLTGEGGRLPTPPVHDWDSFPWDGDIRTKVLRPPVASEEARVGEKPGEPCLRCEHDTENVIWRNENWLVRSTQNPPGLPLVLFLESRTHMDFMDMDDTLASEFGRVSNNLHRIMSYLPNIGRVHLCKWGDGSYHLHVWFVARTERIPQILGSSAVEWNEILPPVPEDIWREDLRVVAKKLANHDGEALV